LKKQKISIVLLAFLLTAFTGPALASCQDVPEALVGLNKAVLTNAEVASLASELEVLLVQLDALRVCINAKSVALTPLAIDPALPDGQAPEVDSAFMVASHALRDAALEVDELEESSILRFNYLAKNAKADQQPSDQSNLTQP
jgi:hypothetical protein